MRAHRCVVCGMRVLAGYSVTGQVVSIFPDLYPAEEVPPTMRVAMRRHTGLLEDLGLVNERYHPAQVYMHHPCDERLFKQREPSQL